MGKCTPDIRFLSKAFNILDIVICKSPELFYHFFLFIGVFIGSYMYLFSYEDGVFSLQVFFEQRIKKVYTSGLDKSK